MVGSELILVDHWRELDERAAALFGRGDAADGTIGWFAALSATTLDADEQLRIALFRQNGQSVACLPLVARSGHWGCRLRGLSAPYTCRFGAPLGDPETARHLGRALGGLATDMLQLDALDDDDPVVLALVQGLRDRGWAVRTQFHFANHYAAITDWTSYWRARPSALRHTVERKRRRLTRDDRLGIEIVGDGPALAAATEAYLDIYADSWKPPEPHPGFIPALVRAAAADRTLRLGIASIDGTPAAAQIWLVAGERATIFKLAHRRALDATSIGSLLTAAMLQQTVERERVRTVDFGRGDDAFKKLWLPERRRRIRVTAANPRRLLGLAQAARHVWVPNLRGRATDDPDPSVGAAQGR
jgi:CelD/BcsL family acetyltransferase involved in cellulose biosynthesis